MPLVRALALTTALLFFFVAVVPVQAVLVRVHAGWGQRVAILFCRCLLWILRVEVVREGVWSMTEPRVLAANHVSWIDILALGSITPFCFLAKKEVAGWPVISAFARVQGTVFIDRSRRRGIPPANQALARRLSEGRDVLLFPEGTTHDGKTLGRFYSSHFAAARDYLRLETAADTVRVQPVAVSYSHDFAAWIGDEGLIPHLWRVLRGEALTCRIAFAPPVLYGPDSDRKEVARAARAAIAAILAEPQGVFADRQGAVWRARGPGISFSAPRVASPPKGSDMHSRP